LIATAQIGRHAKVRRAIIDKGVQIAEGETIGYDRKIARASRSRTQESW
jgi:ADP-glucose pyrophosphorylase